MHLHQLRLLKAVLGKTEEVQLNCVLSLCSRFSGGVFISLRNKHEKDKEQRGKSLTATLGITQCCLIALNIQQ